MPEINMVDIKTDFYKTIDNLQVQPHTLLYQGGDYTKDARITIIITTFNRPYLLKEALDSAANQRTSYMYNILVVDNFSDTFLEPDYFKDAKFNNVKYVRNECNLGMFGNMNQGVALSETDYLCFLHDDDLYSPYFVEKVIDTIDSKKYKAFHIGISKFANGEEIIPQLQTDLEFRKLEEWQMVFRGPGAPTGLVVKRTVFLKLGGFNLDYHPTSDYCYCVLIAHNFDYFITDAVLCYYRVAENESMKPTTLSTFVHNDYYLRDTILKSYNINNTLIKLIQDYMLFDQIKVLRNSYNPTFAFEDTDILKRHRKRGYISYIITRLVIEFLIRKRKWIK